MALVLITCEERAAPPPPLKSEKISVLATIYPLALLARDIGGERVSVEWLAESGQPLPGEDVSFEIRTRARTADFVFSDGEEEVWATEGYDDPLRSHRIIRLDTLHSAADAASVGFRWLDPAVAREAAQEFYNRLSARYPKLDPYFRSRIDRFLADLDVMTRQYGAVLTTNPPRRVLVISPDWLRLLARFGMMPLMPVQSNPSTLTSAQLRQISDVAKANRLTAMFVHADTPASVISDLEARTDLTVLKLDALGSSAGRDNSYLDLLRRNLDQLNRGASPAP